MKECTTVCLTHSPQHLTGFELFTRVRFRRQLGGRPVSPLAPFPYPPPLLSTPLFAMSISLEAGQCLWKFEVILTWFKFLTTILLRYLQEQQSVYILYAKWPLYANLEKALKAGYTACILSKITLIRNSADLVPVLTRVGPDANNWLYSHSLSNIQHRITRINIHIWSHIWQDV